MEPPKYDLQHLGFFEFGFELGLLEGHSYSLKIKGDAIGRYSFFRGGWVCWYFCPNYTFRFENR